MSLFWKKRMNTTDKQDFTKSDKTKNREEVLSHKNSARAATTRNCRKIRPVLTPKNTFYIKYMLKRPCTKDYDPKIGFFGFWLINDRTEICKKTPKMKRSCISTRFYLIIRPNSKKSRNRNCILHVSTYKWPKLRKFSNFSSKFQDFPPKFPKFIQNCQNRSKLPKIAKIAKIDPPTPKIS